MKKLSWGLLLIAVLLGAFYLSRHSFPKIPFLAGPVPAPTATTVPIPQYEIDDIQGTALALLGGQTQAVTAQEGQVFRQGDEVITEKSSRAVLTLNEVTAVKLSESTTIRIAELKPNDTHGFVSRLELIRGKVLSEVEKLIQSRSSFEVEAGGVVCGVRGTAFEVDYQNDETIETNTFHGLVEVSKEQKTEQVAQDQHSIFSVPQDKFLKERSLTSEEQKTYSDWQPVYAMAIQKRQSRLVAQQTLGPTTLVLPSPSPTTASTVAVPTATPKPVAASRPEEPTATLTASSPTATETPLIVNNLTNDLIGIILLHGKNQTPDQLLTLARKLKVQGFKVATPSMPWAQGRSYDTIVENSFNAVDKEVQNLKDQGVQKILVGGIGLGAHMALVYAGNNEAVAGVLMLAPGHYPENFAANHKNIANSVDKARRMSNVGQGDVKDNFLDIENGKINSITTSAANYYSFFAPDGAGSMHQAVKGLKRSIPVLLIAEANPEADAKTLIYDQLPFNNKSLYRISTSLSDTLVDDSIDNILHWLKSVESLE